MDIPFSSSPEITSPFVFKTSLPLFSIPTNFADGDLILFTGLNSTTFPAVGNEGLITIFDNKNNLLGTF